MGHSWIQLKSNPTEELIECNPCSTSEELEAESTAEAGSASSVEERALVQLRRSARTIRRPTRLIEEC